MNLKHFALITTVLASAQPGVLAGEKICYHKVGVNGPNFGERDHAYLVPGDKHSRWLDLRNWVETEGRNEIVHVNTTGFVMFSTTRKYESLYIKSIGLTNLDVPDCYASISGKQELIGGDHEDGYNYYLLYFDYEDFQLEDSCFGPGDRVVPSMVFLTDWDGSRFPWDDPDVDFDDVHFQYCVEEDILPLIITTKVPQGNPVDKPYLVEIDITDTPESQSSQTDSPFLWQDVQVTYVPRTDQKCMKPSNTSYAISETVKKLEFDQGRSLLGVQMYFVPDSENSTCSLVGHPTNFFDSFDYTFPDDCVGDAYLNVLVSKYVMDGVFYYKCVNNFYKLRVDSANAVSGSARMSAIDANHVNLRYKSTDRRCEFFNKPNHQSVLDAAKITFSREIDDLRDTKIDSIRFYRDSKCFVDWNVNDSPNSSDSISIGELIVKSSNCLKVGDVVEMRYTYSTICPYLQTYFAPKVKLTPGSELFIRLQGNQLEDFLQPKFESVKNDCLSDGLPASGTPISLYSLNAITPDAQWYNSVIERVELTDGQDCSFSFGPNLPAGNAIRGDNMDHDTLACFENADSFYAVVHYTGKCRNYPTILPQTFMFDTETFKPGDAVTIKLTSNDVTQKMNPEISRIHMGRLRQ